MQDLSRVEYVGRAIAGASDARGKALAIGDRVHILHLGPSPISGGEVCGLAAEETADHGEPWVWVAHRDGSFLSWPAGELVQDMPAVAALF